MYINKSLVPNNKQAVITFSSNIYEQPNGKYISIEDVLRFFARVLAFGKNKVYNHSHIYGINSYIIVKHNNELLKQLNNVSIIIRYIANPAYNFPSYNDSVVTFNIKPAEIVITQPYKDTHIESIINNYKLKDPRPINIHTYKYPKVIKRFIEKYNEFSINFYANEKNKYTIGSVIDADNSFKDITDNMFYYNTLQPTDEQAVILFYSNVYSESDGTHYISIKDVFEFSAAMFAIGKNKVYTPLPHSGYSYILKHNNKFLQDLNGVYIAIKFKREIIKRFKILEGFRSMNFIIKPNTIVINFTDANMHVDMFMRVNKFKDPRPIDLNSYKFPKAIKAFIKKRKSVINKHFAEK